ncbi:hypothetical protein NHX12_031251 [Muraenolepis orangiensis]|uniref:CD97 antigen-like n=1 Tax=Muraenolepis orangiensis TaxID=630683 RepID=A0A9Q0IJI6_9TELE|nr:hypothetical protein NHX12_031251 [Muraenolepis orangiensis]
MARGGLLLLAAHLSLVMAKCKDGYEKVEPDICIDYNECDDSDDPGSFYCTCEDGLTRSDWQSGSFMPDLAVTCLDINECLQSQICQPHAECHNTVPSYVCICETGFRSLHKERLLANDTCSDIDECLFVDVCGQNAACVNSLGSYHCACHRGFGLKSGQTNFTGNTEICEDACVMDKTLCGNGTCHQDTDGHGHVCACHFGFSNHGNERWRCTELNCEVFIAARNLQEDHPDVQRVLRLLEDGCRDLSESETPAEFNGEEFIRTLLPMIDRLLSDGAIHDNRKVSSLLSVVEEALGLIGPFMSQSRARSWLPPGPATLLTKHAKLEIQWETAAGKYSTYPGFTAVSLLTYTTMENCTNTSFSGMAAANGTRLQINSKVVTVKVSNPDTDHLLEPVRLTFHHLEEFSDEAQAAVHCVFWDSLVHGGSWSTAGCRVLETGANRTVCSCDHLSSFAVLMALHDTEEPFEMQVFTWVGLTLSLVCLFICILTFALIRSIQSPRNSIHLHLCLSLFVANIIFLAGISHTENQIGCAVVAGLLHYFYLAAFCWMCLEGVQLFRMVVLVFHTNFPLIRMLAVGYGVPAVIVGVSALVDSSGYGTEKHCWLSSEGGFRWSFFGPVCLIITVNIFFFLITVWKLAQKFTSLNPDLDNLHKIKAFTVTAVAQLCVLGLTWIFGCFQFEGASVVMSYLFTVLNSLQGVLLFVVHCLLFRPVREEYRRLFSGLSTSQKKKYSEFNSSQSSKAQTSKSIQNTGESNI